MKIRHSKVEKPKHHLCI